MHILMNARLKFSYDCDLAGSEMEYKEAIRLNPNLAEATMAMLTSATSGYAGALRYSAQQLEQLYEKGELYTPGTVAELYARSGDKDPALKWLRITYNDNNRCIPRSRPGVGIYFLAC
jgi:hypothetical protein